MNVMLKKVALFFVGCSLFFSCKNPTSIPIIDFDGIDHSISLDISDMLGDISTVQISADFLVSEYDQIFVTHNYLIIMINNESLHLFGRDGAHIRKLTERGNGPGEFRSIFYFFVDEQEHILYYIENNPKTRLNRIDIHNGIALDPLEIDFTYLTAKYLNGKIYSFPLHTNRVRDRIFDYSQAGDYPDSAIVVGSISLPSGEVEPYRGQHKYTYLALSSSITSYNDEIYLLNLGYSDTLFTLQGGKLSPLCILHFSDKMKNTDVGGSVSEIVSAYHNGIVLSTYNLMPNPMLFYDGDPFFVLYDRKGNVYKLDTIRVMGTPVSLAHAPQSWLLRPTFMPITCGNYGYMLVGQDKLQNLSKDFDPENDNPIIVIGTLK